jgi:hypothetical protein
MVQRGGKGTGEQTRSLYRSLMGFYVGFGSKAPTASGGEPTPDPSTEIKILTFFGFSW